MEMYAYADGCARNAGASPATICSACCSTAEVDGERLTQLQIDIFFLLLQNAGSETTRNLITTGAVALLEHPDQLERAARRPVVAPDRDRGAAALRRRR